MMSPLKEVIIFYDCQICIHTKSSDDSKTAELRCYIIQSQQQNNSSDMTYRLEKSFSIPAVHAVNINTANRKCGKEILLIDQQGNISKI